MTFSEAAMIMMSGGDPPPAPYPMSLDGIKSLKTLATMTVGDFVFEFKEPKMFYAGNMSVREGNYHYGDWTNTWWPSLVINGKIAWANDGISVYERLAWETITDSNGKVYSSITHRITDFKYTSIKLEKQSYGLPYITVGMSFTRKEYWDEDLKRTYNESDDNIYMISYSTGDDSAFTDMGVYEYRKFVESYLDAQAANEPIINIF